MIRDRVMPEDGMTARKGVALLTAQNVVTERMLLLCMHNSMRLSARTANGSRRDICTQKIYSEVDRSFDEISCDRECICVLIQLVS